MKKYRIFTAYCRSIARGVALAVVCMLAHGLSAQTVSISPQTGNVIAALSYDGELHLQDYGGAWVHNQLPLTLVVSDEATLTDNGLMKKHANNIKPDGTSFIVASGNAPEAINHMSLSLPKGYRFTSYKMVLAYQSGAGCTFQEMDGAFSSVKKQVSISLRTTNQTLTRTSMTDKDMGNVLYFRQYHQRRGETSYVTIKSLVVTFECTQQFTEVLTPGNKTTYATDCVALPFATQRVDLGEITRETKGYTSYKYNYNNVKDLHANFLLYDNSGISAGTAIEGRQGDGHITGATASEDKTYMELANDTYWLEVPTDALSQDGKTLIPVGYRIVGASLQCVATTGSEYSSYTVSLYDKTGNTVAATAVVNEDNPSQEISIDGLNNDAVKFCIEGLADGQTAHVALEVQLEALNPYIDKMDVACTQDDGTTTLSNQYLADDFTIGTNGQVNFSVPANFATDKMTFSFNQLHSKYADNTYGPLSASGNARYHFVNSAYYNLIDENLQAHRADAADHDYTDKILLSVAGDKAFRCNNSDNYSTTAEGSSTFVYEEYRYANDTYTAQGGQWSTVQLASGESRDCYLVICDETRYNIALTTTPRHAYYAYYNTRITLSTANYKPVLTYTKVYNDGVMPAGYDANAYVGATVSLVGDDNQPLAEGTGYVYAKQVIDQINADIAEGKSGAPADAQHILYFDASKVNSLLSSADNDTWGSLADLKTTLGVNALVFLPVGVTATLNNVATKSMSGDDFIAENDIVLTDQYPFFSPYDVRVNAANEVSYKRMVAHNNKTKKWVTLLLPFTVAVDAETGKYIHDTDNCEFTFFQMNGSNAFSRSQTAGNLTVTDIDAHFSPFTGANTTVANEAYTVRIDQAETVADQPTLMFIVRQRGATIVKTPVTASSPNIAGATSTGTIDASSVALTCQSTYAGVQVAKEDGVLYFNKDKFVSSSNLDDRFTTVKVLPFRSYYTCSSALNVHSVSISTEPNDEATAVNAIADDDATAADFRLSVQPGLLTIVASRDVLVNVRNISGQTMASKALKAGQAKSVVLPCGIYVVNGTKVVVR